MKYVFLLFIIAISCNFKDLPQEQKKTVHGGIHWFSELYKKDTTIARFTNTPKEATMIVFYCIKPECLVKDTFYLYK